MRKGHTTRRPLPFLDSGSLKTGLTILLSSQDRQEVRGGPRKEERMMHIQQVSENDCEATKLPKLLY